MKFYDTKKEALASTKSARYLVWNKSIKKWGAATRLTKALRNYYDNNTSCEKPSPKTLNIIEFYEWETK